MSCLCSKKMIIFNRCKLQKLFKKKQKKVIAEYIVTFVYFTAEKKASILFVKYSPGDIMKVLVY